MLILWSSAPPITYYDPTYAFDDRIYRMREKQMQDENDFLIAWWSLVQYESEEIKEE